MEVELVMPEFALTGRGREAVIGAAERAAGEIARAFDSDAPDRYLPFITGESFQRDVIIFLSYKGNIPEQKFLVIWPGFHKRSPSDFVFICEMEGGELIADSIKPVMRLEEEPSPGQEGGVELTKDQ